MKQLTIKEVYSKILSKAEKYWNLADLQKGNEEMEDIYRNYAQDYYECAKWLEQTEEINPTK